MVYLFAVSSIRPEELVFKWLDLHPETRDLKVVRAMNKGKLHTPKYHRGSQLGGGQYELPSTLVSCL